jgi:hypothetical protein
MSANTGILTYNNGYYQTSSVYYSPTATITSTGRPVGSFYCFLSRVQSWATETLPPQPTQDQKYLKQTFKNMFVAKKITTNDMALVIERINWTSGIVYDYYDDSVDMYALDTNDSILKHFYVKNKFDQVFKCLWNNNGGVSTYEPYFEPGTFNANQIFQAADDYKWKYMYTISSGLKLKFMDDAWIPVPTGNNIPNPTQSYAGYGSIDVINVTDGGSGYDPANSIITISITGDGKFASANAVVSGGIITDITVANTGTNYTYANATIISTSGSGATAIAPTSPVGGHGFDPASELGARHVMLTAKFDKDESGNLPTDIDFRQLGVLVNPYAYFGTSIGLANASVYKVTTDFTLSTGFGVYTPDEIVYQSATGLYADATYEATVLSFDNINNKIKLINTFGTPVNSTILYGRTTGTARAVLLQETPSFIPFSGYLTYLENREPVQRNADGSEQFKLVLGF